LQFLRLAPQPLPELKRNFDNQLAPRFSVMRKFKKFNIYSSLAKGFSPPAVTELLPTGSAINLDLSAEVGWNYDLGLKGTFFKNLTVDINTFLFKLENTIVQRRDAGGGEFFVNAGKTKQYGVETYLSYPLLQASLKRSQFWFSHTWHQFTYTDFKQGTSDFSGNKIPGIAPHTIASGIDFFAHSGFLAAVTYYFSDKVPLNDNNNAYAEAYHLVGAKIGFQKSLQNVQLKLVAGADNLLNERYSLGNDINAFGGRYYNAAAERNYYASLQFQWLK
jgi:iron complex outermembrane recepter protein